MIGFAITMLVITGVLVALSGFVGREMREDARKRDELVDLFIDPLDRSASSRVSGRR
jgi:archaellum biogenesis protein FlaJ (TadC family)